MLRTARIVLGALAATTAIALTVALASANTVPATAVGGSVQAITPNTLKPSACAGITLTALRAGSGTFSGTAAAELVLGSAGVDTISAAGGSDCVLGGGGGDALYGGAGSDVCIGGPGTDTFGASCETRIQ